MSTGMLLDVTAHVGDVRVSAQCFGGQLALSPGSPSFSVLQEEKPPFFLHVT